MDIFKKVVVATGDAIEKVSKGEVPSFIPDKKSNPGADGENNEKRESDQIAGHDADDQGRKRLIFEDNKVLKLYDPDDVRGIAELRLYQHVAQQVQSGDPIMQTVFQTVIPGFYGTITKQSVGARCPGEYIVMENIFKDLKQGGSEVCLADMKIGDTPTPFERKHKTGSELLDKTLGDAYKRVFVPNLDREGFQVLGIKARDSETGEWVKHGKHLGRSAKALGLDYICNQFLLGCKQDMVYRARVINELCYDLANIQTWLEQQKLYKFRGSSLVLAYIPEPVNKFSGISSSIRQTSPQYPTTPYPVPPPANYIPTIQPEFEQQQQGGIPAAGIIPPAGMVATPQGSVSSFQSFNTNASIASQNNHSSKPRVAIVRLIDFNNWQDGAGQIDEQSLFGVRNIKEILSGLINKSDV